MAGFAGTWINQYESVMVLNVAATGVVTGTYESKVPVSLPPLPLHGCVYGDLITFYVKWKDSAQGIDYKSITSWVGQLAPDQDGNEIIQTLWHLVQDIPDADEEEYIYRQVLNGSDWFYPEGSAPPPHPTKPLQGSTPTIRKK